VFKLLSLAPDSEPISTLWTKIAGSDFFIFSSSNIRFSFNYFSSFKLIILLNGDRPADYIIFGFAGVCIALNVLLMLDIPLILLFISDSFVSRMCIAFCSLSLVFNKGCSEGRLSDYPVFVSAITFFYMKLASLSLSMDPKFIVSFSLISSSLKLFYKFCRKLGCDSFLAGIPLYY
jgi:hypothetical protein